MEKRNLVTKFPILSTSVSSTNYSEALEIISKFSNERKQLSVSALAVHGVMESFLNKNLNNVLNKIDLVLPDGQPLKWVLNIFHKQKLNDRVSGPDLTVLLLKIAEQQNLNVIFYGSTIDTLEKMKINLSKDFPNLNSEFHPSLFKKIDKEEQKKVAMKLENKKPNLIFVGLGCPRQEFWIYENSSYLNCPIIAVGAAFDYIAGNIKRAPITMQKYGLEWLYRFIQEPRRLFYRYIVLNFMFVFLSIFQYLHIDFFSFRSNLKKQTINHTGWS